MGRPERPSMSRPLRAIVVSLSATNPLQEADRHGLAAMGLTVSDPELAQPPAPGLTLALRN